MIRLNKNDETPLWPTQNLHNSSTNSRLIYPVLEDMNVLTKFALHFITPSDFIHEFPLKCIYIWIQLKLNKSKGTR